MIHRVSEHREPMVCRAGRFPYLSADRVVTEPIAVRTDQLRLALAIDRMAKTRIDRHIRRLSGGQPETVSRASACRAQSSADPRAEIRRDHDAIA
jgi:hypothetical protein